MIKIFPVKHTMFAALHLVDQLKNLGVKAKIVNSIDRRDASLHVIYNASAASVLPKMYVVMQTEIPNTHWFNARYINTLKKSVCIWEYNHQNIPAYENYHSKIAHVSPGVSRQEKIKKDIPVLFYGWIKGSDRRERLLNELISQLPIEIVTNKLEHEMWGLLSRSKVVVNLHYHDFSPLELFRINEALSFNCHVVSEGFSQRHSMVKFVNSVSGIVDNINHLLNQESDHDLSELDNLEEIKNALKLL